MMATTRKTGLILIILISLSIFNTVSGISYYETTGSNNFKIELAQQFWNGDANNNKIDDLIDQKLAVGCSSRVDVFINYAVHPEEKDIDRLTKLEVEISHICKYINTVCVREVPISLIPEIAAIPNVVRIEQQPMLQPELDVSTRAMKARESDNYSPNTAWELGYTGEGLTIAILDTGVDDRHDSLAFKFVAGVDFTQDESFLVPRDGTYNPDDADGHGTHCAGIAMGTGGDDANYIGVAPDAELVDVKVLNNWGPSPGDQLIQGLEWCIEYKDEFEIDILSISIGDRIAGDDNGQSTTGLLINAAVNDGLVVVVAAGNDGPNNDGFSDVAAADLAITVGAIDDMDSVTRNDDEIADFSSRGPRSEDGDNDRKDELKPDVVAPGVSIFSAMYSVSPLGAVTGYQAHSGTSMACPHVAGLAALMLEAFPELTPGEVKEVLRESAESKGNTYDRNLDPKYNEDYGWGMVDAHSTILKCLSKYRIVEFTSLAAGDVLAGKIVINGETSTELGNIERIELKFGDQSWGVANGTMTWNYEWQTTGLANGQYQVSARAYNGLMYSNETTITIRLNNLKCEITTPSDGNSVSGSITIEGTVIGSNIQKLQIKIDDGSWQEAEQVGHKENSDPNNPTTMLWEYDWDTEGVSDGRHNIYVRAYGQNKYNTPSESIRIQVDVDNSSSGLGNIPGFEIGILLVILIGALVIILFFKRRNAR